MSINNKIFITGIGTDVGKTVVSAILRKASNAVYWKPVQAGDLDNSDSMKVEALSQIDVPVLEEHFRLNTPASPHLAAELDGVFIRQEDLQLPETAEKLIIEGAGGLMVPVNNQGLLYVDVLEKWNIPVVLVSRHYLGSINHTLLSLELLKQRNIEVKVLIFVGDENPATESIIATRFPKLTVHRISFATNLNAEFIAEEAAKISFELFA